MQKSDLRKLGNILRTLALQRQVDEIVKSVSELESTVREYGIKEALSMLEDYSEEYRLEIHPNFNEFRSKDDA